MCFFKDFYLGAGDKDTGGLENLRCLAFFTNGSWNKWISSSYSSHHLSALFFIYEQRLLPLTPDCIHLT